MKKWRCTVCGYIHKGDDPPDTCPVCGAPKDSFEEVVEQAAEKKELPEDSPATTPPTATKWRCTVCGYIHAGAEPPDKCPVCGADKSVFEPYLDDSPQPAEKPKLIKPAAAAAEKAEPSTAATQDDRQFELGPVPAIKYGNLYQQVITQMLKHHAHPISVHIPNGVLPMAFIFIVLAILTGSVGLGYAAYYSLVFVVVTMPFVLFSGYIEWQKRYQGFRSNRFMTKIACAGVVALLSLLAVIWWTLNPALLTSGARWGFVLINLITLAAAAIAGLIGGKLVFKD